MARLPQPGGWCRQLGAVLNEFLTQAHKSDGTLKDNVVTEAAIAPGVVSSTSTKIQQ